MTTGFQGACFIRYHAFGELRTDLKEAKKGLFHVLKVPFLLNDSNFVSSVISLCDVKNLYHLY